MQKVYETDIYYMSSIYVYTSYMQNLYKVQSSATLLILCQHGARHPKSSMGLSLEVCECQYRRSRGNVVLKGRLPNHYFSGPVIYTPVFHGDQILLTLYAVAYRAAEVPQPWAGAAVFTKKPVLIC